MKGGTVVGRALKGLLLQPAYTRIVLTWRLAHLVLIVTITFVAAATAAAAAAQLVVDSWQNWSILWPNERPSETIEVNK